MPNLPTTFKKAAEGAIASYSYTDIVTGTGFVNYFPIQSATGTGGTLSYHLTAQEDYSNSIKIQQTAAFDEDFDLSPFKLPQRIDGKVAINIPVAGAGSDSTDLDFELYNWDGSSETQIGTTVRHRFTAAAADMAYITMDVVNAHFKKGDVLRLRIQKSSTTQSTGFGIDPKGRTDATFTITTQLKLSIPFRIDL